MSLKHLLTPNSHSFQGELHQREAFRAGCVHTAEFPAWQEAQTEVSLLPQDLALSPLSPVLSQGDSVQHVIPATKQALG